jgi:hypothetical protein
MADDLRADLEQLRSRLDFRFWIAEEIDRILARRPVRRAGKGGVMRILWCIIGIFAVALAGWMIWDTHTSFPHDTFVSLIPGYVVFPAIMLLIAAAGAFSIAFNEEEE